MLNRSKLDVVSKTQSNPLPWRGQFTPELVAYLLEEYAPANALVADPFSGSGTVLAEAARRNYSCVGFDINPSAFYMSKFYEYSTLSFDGRRSLMTEIINAVSDKILAYGDDTLVYTEDDDYRKAYANLLGFAKWVATQTSERFWPLLINVVFLCEKNKKMPLKQALSANISKMRTFLYSLPQTKADVNVRNEDARRIAGHYEDMIDLIITSPPYINVINYHQNFRAIVECFNYNLLDVANSEIGANRKHRSNRYKTVVQYAEDMGRVLCEAAKALKKGGKMVIVVGKESNVCKTPFYNSQIIADLVQLVPSISLVDLNHRVFTNRYGEHIQEDVLTIEKNGTGAADCQTLCFEKVGFKHLEAALTYSPEENRRDIYTILNGKDKVTESPIMN